MNTTDTIAKVITDGVSDMFGNLAREYDLKTGDIAPEQALRLDNIKQDMTDLMGDYVHQNLPEDNGESA